MRASCWRRWRQRPSLKLVAVHVHVGSQITTLEPLRRAAALAARRQPRAAATPASPLEYVDLGGGLGISYDGARGARRRPSTCRALRRRGARRPACRSSSSRAARSRRRRACCSRASSTSSRATATSEFAVIDAGMTELMRPALYSAFHRIEPVAAAADRRPALRDRRPGLREQRRRRPRPHAAAARRSATSSRSATPAPTDRRWRRTTIAVRCPPKCWSTTARWRVIRRRQTVDDMLRSNRRLR